LSSRTPGILREKPSFDQIILTCASGRRKEADRESDCARCVHRWLCRTSSTSETRLSGRWILLTRLASGAAALLAVGLFTVGLIIRFAHLSYLTSYDVPSDWSPELLRATLAQVTLSVGMYQLYRILCDLVFAPCYLLVAALLMWRALPASNER